MSERPSLFPPVPEGAPPQLVTRDEWEWFGSAAHLIVGSDCRFHLATLVGPWLVSTVGEWLPDSGSWDIYADRVGGIPSHLRGDERRNWFLREVGFIEIGAGRKYETMIFRAGERCSDPECGCGLPSAADWSELDSDGYNAAGAATIGHYVMCDKWSRIDAADAERVENAWRDHDEATS